MSSMQDDPLTLMKKDIQVFFRPFRRRSALLIFILGILVFANGLVNEFIGDDYGQIVDNPMVHSLGNLDKAFGVSTFYSGGMVFGAYYKPLMQIYFTLIYSIFGQGTFWFHLFQLFIHIANAILLFLFFGHFFRERTALALSLVFLVHPINSESVLSIAATQEVLFFFFGLAALLTLRRYGLKKYPVWVGVLIFLSLISKETGVLFAVSIISYAALLDRPKLPRTALLVSLALILYFILKTNAVGLIPNPGNSPIDRLDLPQRLLNIPEMIWFYFRSFLFPIHLAHGYHWAYAKPNFDHFWLPLSIGLTIFTTIACLAFGIRKKFPDHFRPYLFFLGILVSGLLLHMQIIPLDLTASERWFYFPIFGLLGMIGILSETFFRKINPKILTSISIVIIVLLAGRTFVRTFDWRDQLTLSYRDMEVSKEDFSSMSYIASELLAEGKPEEALRYVERSIAIFPSFQNHNILGMIYTKQGEYEKAKLAYLSGLKYGSSYYPLYSNLAGLSQIYGDRDENIRFLETAVAKFPQSARLWAILALLEYKNGNVRDAKTAINEAYKYDRGDEVSTLHSLILSDKPLETKTDRVSN